MFFLQAVELFMDGKVQKVVKYYYHHSDQNVVKLKWMHLEGAFAALAMGYLIGSIIFLCEILAYRYQKLK